MLSSILLSAYVGAPPQLDVAIQQSGSIIETHSLEMREGAHVRIVLTESSSQPDCPSNLAYAYSDGPCVLQSKKAVDSIRWFLLVPEARDYDNPKYCHGGLNLRHCHQPIAYHEEALPALSGLAGFDIADAPELRTAGTHRIIARMSWNGLTLSIPKEAHTLGPDYVGASALAIVVRRDDSYVGRLSELLGTPFVLGPSYVAGLGHETDARVGADCVALVIYGRRRLGDAVPYMAPAALHERLSSVGKASSLVDSDGRVAPIGPLQLGDVLYFGFQTAVISRGLTAGGYLASTTKVIHSYHGLAEEVALEALPYRSSPVEILRWAAEAR